MTEGIDLMDTSFSLRLISVEPSSSDPDYHLMTSYGGSDYSGSGSNFHEAYCALKEAIWKATKR